MSAPRCKDCKGTGQQAWGSQEQYTRTCYKCEGEGRDKRWGQPENSMLVAGDYCNTGTVGVSNVRVWRELHSASEGTLWRYKTGGYGSTWIEVRQEILTALDDPSGAGRSLLRHAERLNLTGLVGVIESLQALEQYPLLDEGDHSEVEQEEQEEHWESYGRSGLESALRDLDENLNDNFKACLEATGEKSLDSLYWSVSEDLSKYPEKTDGSAYDFGIESGGWAVIGLYDRLVPESMRGLTPEEFSVALDARLDASITTEDLIAMMQEGDAT